MGDFSPLVMSQMAVSGRVRRWRGRSMSRRLPVRVTLATFRYRRFKALGGRDHARETILPCAAVMLVIWASSGVEARSAESMTSGTALLRRWTHERLAFPTAWHTILRRSAPTGWESVLTQVRHRFPAA